MKFEFIAENIDHFPLSELCEALEVARSAYHAWRTRKPSARQRQDRLLEQEILQIHERVKGRYGHRPMHRHLHGCGRDRTLRLMQSLGIAGKRARRYRPQCTDSRHNYGYSPNRLPEQGPLRQTDEVWVADTTYVKIQQGWAYVATVMDLYSRRIVGWSVSRNNDSRLVCQALENARETRGRLRQGIIHHSDRGSTYASHTYRARLTRLGMQSSMSGRGNCYDNAAMESFYGRFKTSTLPDRTLADEQEVRAVVFEYIEPFYNRYRKHSSLGYRSPVEFEQTNLPLPPAGGNGKQGGTAVFTQNQNSDK